MTPRKPTPSPPSGGTPCCRVPAYLEPIFYVVPPSTVRARFGVVRSCSGCRAPVGAVKLDYAEVGTDLHAVQKLYNATSWQAMIEVKRAVHGAVMPPYYFKAGGFGILVPEDYAGELPTDPAQGE